MRRGKKTKSKETQSEICFSVLIRGYFITIARSASKRRIKARTMCKFNGSLRTHARTQSHIESIELAELSQVTSIG